MEFLLTRGGKCGEVKCAGAGRTEVVGGEGSLPPQEKSR